jgi:hypothetical protein
VVGNIDAREFVGVSGVVINVEDDDDKFESDFV